MRPLLPALITVVALSAPAAMAQTYQQQQQEYQAKQQEYQDKQQTYQDQQAQYQAQKQQYRHELHRWARGSVLPHRYFVDRYYVNDWQARHLRAPGDGYRWVRDEDGNFVLARIDTGVISDVVVVERR